MNWQELAACSGADLSLFFPPENIGGPKMGKGVAGEHERIRAAKAICGACPVRRECLQFAVLHGCTGIWGGMDTKERSRYAAMVS